MDFSLDNPLVQTAVLPFLLGIMVTGGIRLLGGEQFGKKLACVGISLSFIAAIWLIIGFPSFPAVSSSQKLAYITASSLLLGVYLDIRKPSSTFHNCVLLLWALSVPFWLASNLLRSPDVATLTRLAALTVTCLLVFWRLSACTNKGQMPFIMLLFACFGIGGASLLGGSASIGQLSFALMAACGGFILWNWPTHRFPWGYSALLGGAGSLLALTSQTVLFVQMPSAGLLLLLPLLFADRLAVYFTTANSRQSALTPIYFAMICAASVTPALIVIYLLSEPSYSY